jgi:ABC-type nickel/cobalt efflux system permease component RcnA
MEYSFLIIFWYGILHAFGPDHLSAIADFSIGKSRRKTLLITTAFAIGHGISLFIFAKILEYISLPDNILVYGDIISSTIIILIGLYLLFMAWSDRINLTKHIHNSEEHIHIYFGDSHNHKDDFKTRTSSALSVGALMGIGGVRGMLITLSAISHNSVNIYMVLSFTIGVMVIFISFGYIIALINDNLLTSRRNVRAVFAVAGSISLIVGGEILI